MDIAGASMRMASTEFQTAASMAVLKKSMDTQEMQAEALAMMLQSAVQATPTGLGDIMDTYA